MGIRMSGLMSGLDTESIVGALMSAQSLKKTKVSNAKTKLEWKQTKWKELNTKLYGFYTGAVSKMRMQSAYMTKKTSVANSAVAGVTAGAGAVNGSYTMTVKKIATSQYVTGGKLSNVTDTSMKLSQISNSLSAEVTIKANGKEDITITNGMTVAQFTKELSDRGLDAFFDTTQQRFFISSKTSGAESAFELTSSDGGDALKALGLSQIVKNENDDVVVTSSFTWDEEAGAFKDSGSGMTLVTAQDSEIILNGATLTSKSATVSANGLNISLTQLGNTSFTVATDVDAIYNSIKSALTDYNNILKEMNTLYSAESAKGYDPLTSEQKKAMSDDEVKEWEDKIKGSLLRSDTTLSGIVQSIRSAMRTSVEYEGNQYTLASFGITTSSNYNEGGLYHIYGDKDDSTFSDNEDRLRKAIEEDPDKVMNVMSEIFEKLHDNMFNKMKASSLSSALTFYNDIQMNTQMKDYESELSKWEDRLASMEDSYYAKFTAMESAIAKLQSQQSSLGSLFGGQ